MALFPKRVDVDAASIATLVAMYKDAADYVRNTIFEVGRQKITVTSVRMAKALIAARLAELHQTAGPWAEDQISNVYDQGQQDCIEELRSFHDRRTDQLAAAIAAGAALAIHQDAKTQLTNELSSRLSDATASMGRSADKTLGQLLRGSIAARLEDAGEGASRLAQRHAVLKAFDDQGVYALMDAAGKRWTPSVYADMVANTLSASTRNTAMTYSLRSQGYDLVRVSAHGASDACREWEDSILSLSGETPGYFTVADATGAGLFHVNCKHSIDPVDISDYPPDYLPSNITQDQLDTETIDLE